MKTGFVRRLPIARDLTAEEIARLEEARVRCRRHFELRGYAGIETPLLEQTELFLRKSGGELASRLYSFTDPGGFAVSLRPEYTAPVIRYVIEEIGISDLPLRFQYSGPVFRYPTPGTPAEKEPGAFLQAGAELIGASAPRGDGEIMAMAWSGLVELGIASPRLTIGHVGLLWDLLQAFELSDRAQLFLVQSVGRLRAGGPVRDEVRHQAADIGLFRNGEAVTGYGEAPAASIEVVESLLSRTLGGPIAQTSGARTAHEIMARLALKLRNVDDEKMLDAALDFIADIAKVHGKPAEVIDRGSKMARAAKHKETVFAQLEAIVDSALAQGVPDSAITVDLGLARDIAYYTGAVFDLIAPDRSGVSYGGGGRYDGLMYSLGAGADIPATGFAYNLDSVIAASTRIRTGKTGRRVLVSPATSGAFRAAAAYAESLRKEGAVAILTMGPLSRTELVRTGRTSGATEVAVVDDAGTPRLERL
ncbi:MAG: ATP phosphoribosyltransferase regulatory subunit [Chloroflexi bacterium]|nr:ATP phosphoribosyltransferase regulatory subunit [Chloroflexota bacterium]